MACLLRMLSGGYLALRSVESRCVFRILENNLTSCLRDMSSINIGPLRDRAVVIRKKWRGASTRESEVDVVYSPFVTCIYLIRILAVLTLRFGAGSG